MNLSIPEEHLTCLSRKVGYVIPFRPPHPEATMIDWSECPDVERIPGKVSGQWIVVGTRILAMTPHPGRLPATFDVPTESRTRGTAVFADLESQIQQRVFAAPEL